MNTSVQPDIALLEKFAAVESVRRHAEGYLLEFVLVREDGYRLLIEVVESWDMAWLEISEAKHEP